MKKGILILLLCIVTSSGIYAQIGSKVDMDNIAASVIMQTWAYDAESFFSTSLNSMIRADGLRQMSICMT